MIKRIWILPAALFLAACSGAPAWQKVEDGTAGIEQDRYACARVAGREIPDAPGAYGDLYGPRDVSNLETDRDRLRYYSDRRFLFRDPYFDPGNARFREDLFRDCLRDRGWRPGGAS